MKSVPSRPRRSRPNSALVTYLDYRNNWCSPSLPILCDDTRLRRARNSKKAAQDNNDLLEFIGDRVVNLACALMVEKVKYSADHQMVRCFSVSSIHFLTCLSFHKVGRENHQQQRYARTSRISTTASRARSPGSARFIPSPRLEPRMLRLSS
jgi:hypothetical protein